MNNHFQKYKVLITTSGVGSRLGQLTSDKNKALIKINEKSVIEYIIESYPKDIELVVTIGYLSIQVKDFVKNKYPERKITFVQIDTYKGKGSSLGYSMLQAKKYLQCPFIFHCNDTIVFGKIPPPTQMNWNAGSNGTEPLLYNTQMYSSFLTDKNNVIEINPKGIFSYDYFHIGLVGIRDYHTFWYYLEKVYRENPEEETLNDTVAINLMIKKGSIFHSIEFENWFDTGNLDTLENTTRIIKFFR